MKRLRWSANTWILIILLGILVVAGVEVGRAMMIEAKQEMGPLVTAYEPEFGVGDEAPDFTLKDSSGQERRFSELVNRETLLCFSCGCSNCREVQTYLGLLLKEMGDRAPQVVTVATIPPEAEKAYLRDIGFEHLMLFETRERIVMDQYRGHPCPRLYKLDGVRKVAWISESPARTRDMAYIGEELTHTLGFAMATDKDRAGKPLAPEFEFSPVAPDNDMGFPTAGPTLPTSQGITAHTPHDGHNH